MVLPCGMGMWWRRGVKDGAVPVEVGAQGYLRWIDKRELSIPGGVQLTNNLPAAPPTLDHSNWRVGGNVPTKNVDMVPPSASTVLTFLTNCMCDAVPHGSFVLYIKRQSFFVFPMDL